MDKLYAFVDKIVIFREEAPILNLLLKIVIALGVAFLCWLILKRILSSVQKRIEKYKMIRINPQSFDIIRKAVFYLLL